MKQCTVYDAITGRLKAKGFCRHDGSVEKIERYDTAGNKTEEAIYDGSSRLKTGIDGWAARRWWYHDSILRSQISYDENGKAIERKQYDESGRLVARQYREGLDDEVPYEAASMALMLGGGNFRYPDKDLVLKETAPMMKE